MTDAASEHAVLHVDGQALEVRRAEGREALSELFRYEITAGSSTGDGDLVGWAGAAASLVLSDGHGGQRTVSGIVAEAGSFVHDDGSVLIDVVLTPQAHLLTLGSNCRPFIEKTVVEIVDEILGGVPHRWELTSSYEVREHTVQYRESDWQTIVRLLEEEGIHYWFDHASGSQLVLSDDSTASPDLVGGAVIPYLEETGMTNEQERIEELGGHGAMGPTAFATSSFDPQNPSLDVGGATGEGPLEYRDAPGAGPRTPAGCARQVAFGLQAQASRQGVSGKASSVRLCPGRVVEPRDHPFDNHNRRLLVKATRISIVQRQREGGSDQRPFQLWFDAMDAEAPFRPARRSPPAIQPGLQTAEVVGPAGEEIHSDEQGRVRLRMRWDRSGGPGWWARVAQRGADGSLQLPRIGWNVLTFSEEGAAQAPNVMARIHDGEHPPAYSLPDNKTRVVYKTATSPADGTFNEIYFEDRKGAEQMFINASRDMKILAQHVKSEGVGNDSLRQVGEDHTLEVKSAVDEQIHGNQTTSVGGNDAIETGSSLNEAAGGNITTTVGGARRIEVGTSHTLQSSSTRSLTVGAALIDTSLGDVTASSQVMSLLVGGAQLKVAASNINQESGGVGVFTVGGVKLELTDRSKSVAVDGQYVESVGGVLMYKTKQKLSDTAEETSTWRAGAKLEGKGPEIKVAAEESITIACGSSSVTIEPKSITIKASNLDLSAATDLEVSTKKIEHN